TSCSFTPAHFDVAVHPCIHECTAMYCCFGMSLSSSRLTSMLVSLSSPPSSSRPSAHLLSRYCSHSGDSSWVGGSPLVQWYSERCFSVNTFWVDIRERIQLRNTLRPGSVTATRKR